MVSLSLDKKVKCKNVANTLIDTFHITSSTCLSLTRNTPTNKYINTHKVLIAVTSNLFVTL